MNCGLMLTLTYALIGALLLLIMVRSRLTRLLKLSLILLVSAFYIATWFGYRDVLGWPTTASPPDAFRVLWITIDDPNKASKAPGAIFFWLRALDEAGLPVGAPRAHSIPWSNEAAEDAQSALERLEAGEPLNGRISRNQVEQSDQSTLEDPGYEAGNPSPLGDGFEPTFEFIEVASPSLPAKGN